MQNAPIEMYELYNPAMKTSPEWFFVSDQVMGGVSNGQVSFKKNETSPCHCLTGKVSLENNGGFLQMQLVHLDDLNIHFNDFKGIYIEVKGNNHQYNLHLRTSQLLLPWQSFRQQFFASEKWQRLFFSFEEFTSYKTFSKLNPAKISRLGILAIGEAFESNICIRNLGLYR
ncbi:MAG TPA: hypothetical protein ENK73_00635 [Thiomicrospira sp.]|jgi:hypothetical protein|nr:hypothetical protein [Thiomicrospira sp.]